MSARAAVTDEQGFTLLELIVAISLLGIIMIPLAAAFTVAGSASQNARDRLEGSTASLFASAYWADDVQSADTITIGGSACSGGSAEVTFAWAADPTAPTGAQSQASYAVRDAAGGGKRLVRIACGGSSATNTLVPRLGTVKGVSCDPSCTPSASAAAAPIRVKMTLSTVGTKTEPDGVEFTVSGTRRSTAKAAA